MSDKKYQLSLEQLNDIVGDAVTNAIKKFDNIELVVSTNGDAKFDVGEFSEEQYPEAMDVMHRNRGSGDEPKVDIFWYNPTLKELFGVVNRCNLKAD